MNTICRLSEKLKDPEYRKAFVSSQINIGIPFQIRTLMKARGWTQEKLAEKTQMLQPRISGLITPGKTHPNIETLRRIAEAFDCGLIVRFAPFGELMRWSEEFDPEAFDVPSFEEERSDIERAAQPEAVAPASLRYVVLNPVNIPSWDFMPQAGNQTLFAGPRVFESGTILTRPINLSSVPDPEHFETVVDTGAHHAGHILEFRIKEPPPAQIGEAKSQEHLCA